MAAAAAMCGALAVTPALSAAADDVIDTSGIEVMGQYPAANFVAEAQELSPELVASLDADLGITGEEFIAQSEATAQAVTVVDSLESAGVEILGSRIDGTTLTINVLSDAEAAAVNGAGAIGVIGEPAPYVAPRLPLMFAADPVSNFYGGQGYYYETAANTAFRCTSGFNGFSSSGAQQLLSAGHCVRDVRGSVIALNMTSPNQTATQAQLGATLGNAVAGSAQLGDGYDAGLVNISNPSVRPRPSVLRWGGGTGSPLSSTPLRITGSSRTLVGASVCKSGSTTGWACGKVLQVDSVANVEGDLVNSVVTNACTKQGDSGGPMVSGTLAIGITSWATDAPCSDPDFESGAFPMLSGPGNASVAALYGSSWKLAIDPLAGVAVSRISGTDRIDTAIKVSNAMYPAGSPTSIPVVYVTTGNNYPDALSAAPAAAKQGGVLLLTQPGALPANVRAEILRLKPGKIVVVGGANSVSGAVYAALKKLQPSILRIGGTDRYETSRNIVNYAFPTASAAYVATGANFPDALSASGAGGALGIPVILVPGYQAAIDAPTSALLKKTKVVSITVIGGPASMSEGMKTSLGRIAPTTRISGADRFETSNNIAFTAFGSRNPSELFLATGYNFPDALAGAVLAGARKAPLIVVPTDCIPAYVLTSLQRFGTKKVTLLGGTSALTKDVASLQQC